MARDFIINGPCLVKVRGGNHMSGSAISRIAELGLTSEAISIEADFKHKGIMAADFGPEIPAERQWMLGEVTLRMELVHFDNDILDICMSESMGGGALPYGAANDKQPAGTLAPAGTPMGNGLPMFASGNHYVSVNLTSPVFELPWRFRHCYLSERPFVYQVGASKSQVQLTWKAVAYSPIWVSGTIKTDQDFVSPTYTLPPGIISGDITEDGGGIELELELNEDDEGVAQPYVLTGEVLSSGLTIWDRTEDIEGL